MPTSVDHGAALQILNRAWAATLGKISVLPPEMMRSIDGVMSASDVTFKYILVTGYLAKLTNPKIHARALQTGSDLKESYDARSLCHKVIVPFEKSKGNLFGLSNEPFVNKPARHPEHDQNNNQLRSRNGAKMLHVALELAQTSTPEQVFAGMAYILIRGKAQAASEKQAQVLTAVSIPRVHRFCFEFLAETDGGARLVAIWAAFTSLLAEDATVKVESPNAADIYANTSGDVEVSYEETIVSASECKQRPLTADDIRHGLRKAARNNIPEYLFVISAGIADGQNAGVESALIEGNLQIDTAIIDINRELPWLVRSLNPFRRGKFGESVVAACRKMRKFSSANAAAELWGRIT